MSLEENKALIRRWNEGGCRDYDAYPDYLHEDYIIYDPTKVGADGSMRREEFKQAFREKSARYPKNVVFEIQDIIAEGDMVAARLTFLYEGKPVASQIQWYRIAEGKMVEGWYCTQPIEQD